MIVVIYDCYIFEVQAPEHFELVFGSLGTLTTTNIVRLS